MRQRALLHRAMRRYDLCMETYEGWYYLYCRPDGTPRKCSFNSRRTGELKSVNTFMLPFMEVRRIWINEIRAVKYLLRHHLRPLTERAVCAFALDIIPRDMQRIIAFIILRSIDVIVILDNNIYT